MAAVFRKTITDKEKFIQQLYDALYFATIISYAQGFALLHKASSELNMEIPLPNVIKIWRGGCIIRSALLDNFYSVYKKDAGLPNMLLNKKIARLLKSKEKKLRIILKQVNAMRIPVAGFPLHLPILMRIAAVNYPLILYRHKEIFLVRICISGLIKKECFIMNGNRCLSIKKKKSGINRKVDWLTS